MPRMFTLDDAEALLPRLRETLAELQERKRRIDHAQEQIAALTGRASGNGHLLAKELADRRKEADELAQQVNALLQELGQLGCELKGIDEGLVDFPSEREGRVVYLCWQLGEERIEHWHELDAGFAGRQRL